MTAAEFDPYATLNLAENASPSDAQRHYKLLSRAFHPDKSPPEQREESQQSFIRIQQAHEILTDPIYRLAYETIGWEAVVLLKSQRRQDRRRQQKANEGDTEQQLPEDNDDGRTTLYRLVKKALDEQSVQEAVKVLRDIHADYKFQLEKRCHQQHGIQWSVNSHMPHSMVEGRWWEPVLADKQQRQQTQWHLQRQWGKLTGSLTCAAQDHQTHTTW